MLRRTKKKALLPMSAKKEKIEGKSKEKKNRALDSSLTSSRKKTGERRVKVLQKKA